jgi:hypothetical protein
MQKVSGKTPNSGSPIHPVCRPISGFADRNSCFLQHGQQGGPRKVLLASKSHARQRQVTPGIYPAIPAHKNRGNPTPGQFATHTFLFPNLHSTLTSQIRCWTCACAQIAHSTLVSMGMPGCFTVQSKSLETLVTCGAPWWQGFSVLQTIFKQISGNNSVGFKLYSTKCAKCHHLSKDSNIFRTSSVFVELSIQRRSTGAVIVKKAMPAIKRNYFLSL